MWKDFFWVGAIVLTFLEIFQLFVYDSYTKSWKFSRSGNVDMPSTRPRLPHPAPQVMLTAVPDLAERAFLLAFAQAAKIACWQGRA